MREKKSKWSFKDLCQRCVKWFFPSADSAAALPSTSQERDQPMHKPLHPIMDRPTIDVPSVSVDVETANAITSSSGVGSHNFNVLSHTYDVFLNHRGPDVKTTFVAHLYEALCKAGFHPFLDVKSLVKGQHAFKSIDEALNSARVHVAVFSKGYAESKYCLNELCDMLKSGKLILPIFLDVEPEHLTRPHHGPFATGFQKHMKRGRQDDIKRWEKALFEVANVTGFRLNEVNGYAFQPLHLSHFTLMPNIEGQFLENGDNFRNVDLMVDCKIGCRDEAQLLRKVVRAIQSALPVGLLQQVVQHRIGLQGPVIEVVNYLHQVGILGIVGMGGIGKTTLAKEVYNEYAKQQSFECQSFLHDVRASSLLSLQKQLVQDLLGEDLKSVEEFHNFFNRILRDQKVLIVIDGIDDKWQFDQLIPSLDKLLMQGSQVIVTSRDRNVLNYITSRSSTRESKLYEVQVLDCIHARQLFNWHAFYSDKASDGFQDLAKEVADSCNGLPLALEVMGAYLFDKKAPKHEVIWTESAKSLRVDPGAIDHKLQKMFDISYEGLSSPTDKLMFLDIACSMIGQHESPIMNIWESCIICTCPSSKSPHSSLMRLIDKSLVKLDENKNFQMHAVLRDMGKGVVKRQSLQEVGKRTHLWEPLETKEVLENDKGTTKIRSFSLVGANLNTPLVAEKFARMTRLHFLHLGGHHVKGDFSTWSKELRWLDWSFSPILGLPPTLNVPNLVVLNLTGCMDLTCLWAEDPHIQVPCISLEWLILRDCTTLVMLPGNIGRLSKLKFLDLRACSTLKNLPDSISQLQSLEVLYLSTCINLATLSDNFGNLSKLKEVFLDHCKSLKELPYGFGKLQSLVTFSAQGTSLFHLPNSFSQLFNMETLNLDDCMDLQGLPPSISGLVKLRCLWMRNTRLEELPEDFGQLQSLKELHLNHCKHLKTLPNSFGWLEQLEYLDMSYNPCLEVLPKSFGRLKALDYLELQGCSIGGKIGLPLKFAELTMLRILSLDKTLIQILPKSFKDLNALLNLHIHQCPNLVSIEALPRNLEYFDIAQCPKLVDIPCLSNLSSLKYFMLHDCPRLTHFQGLESMKALVQVRISGCKMLYTNPSMNHDGTLQMRNLNGSMMSMKYDTDWWKREPALQVISYYDNVFPQLFLQCTQNVFQQQSINKFCLNATILSEKECVAIIFYFYAYDMDQHSTHASNLNLYHKNICPIEARIQKNGQVVYKCHLFALRHDDPTDNVYFCTLRRHHKFVRLLQFDDEVGVYAQFSDVKWARIVVKKGAIIMVHGEDGDENIVVNSEMLNTSKSKDLRMEFLKLNFENKP